MGLNSSSQSSGPSSSQSSTQSTISTVVVPNDIDSFDNCSVHSGSTATHTRIAQAFMGLNTSSQTSGSSSSPDGLSVYSGSTATYTRIAQAFMGIDISSQTGFLCDSTEGCNLMNIHPLFLECFPNEIIKGP